MGNGQLTRAFTQPTNHSDS